METNLEREAKSVKMFDGLVHKLVKFPCPKKVLGVPALLAHHLLN
jgi:hypothetical protein